MSETEIIKGCLRNDRSCQQALYEKHYGKMMGVCMRYAKSRDEAKDMLQEGFMKVFAKLRSFSGQGSFEGWVRRIMVNNAIDTLRKNKQEYMIVSTVKIVDESAEEESFLEEDDLLRSISKEDIMNAVQHLTPAYRTVFNLYVIDEFSHKEISEMLDISEGTSKSNLSKAKFNLRKMLNHLVLERT